MTKIRYNQSSNTLGQIVLAAGVIAMYSFPAIALPQDVTKQSSKSILGVAYRPKNNSATYSHIGNPFSGEYNNAPEIFEQAVENFYEQLLTHQEPLGDEFERVLHQNLWDLYES